MSDRLKAVLSDAITDPESGWSMGSFGAIAEFHQDVDEPLRLDSPEMLTRATTRGAIRIDRSVLGDIKPVAFESISPRRDRWTHALALCIPRSGLIANQRNVLTSIGPDKQAILSQDRCAELFDMGLGLKQFDFCIRTTNSNLIDILNANVGRSIFDESSTALNAILHEHPHRVALTRLGRIEVFQKIGGPHTGGASPPGPHTHVLPKLIKTGRIHSANAPIPDNVIVCGYLHPGNPVIDAMGNDREFDETLLVRFDALLRAYAPRHLLKTKHDVISSIRVGDSPHSFTRSFGRHERGVLRVTLRQLAQKTKCGEETELAKRIADWRAYFDQNAIAADDHEGDHHS